MLFEISYILLFAFVYGTLYNYIKFIINKSKLEKEEELYMQLINNKFYHFKYMNENNINDLNKKINEIIEMYNIYIVRFRILNSQRYNENLKIIKKYGTKYLVLQNIKQLVNNNNNLYLKINSLIYQTNTNIDIENNYNIIPKLSNNNNYLSII